MTMPTTIRCPVCESATLNYRKPTRGCLPASWDCPRCGRWLSIHLLAHLKRCGLLVMLRKCVIVNGEAWRAKGFRDVIGRNG